MHIQFTDGISWDEDKRLRNLQRHGIDFQDLEGFFGGDTVTREDTLKVYGETRFQTVGLSCEVVLFVVWTPRGIDCEAIHVISARKAQNHEIKAWLFRYSKH